MKHATRTMQEIQEEMGWSDAKIAELALSFMVRKGRRLLDEFEGYVIRAAKNEAEELVRR